MIPNPACLGLEALFSNDKIASQQIHRMHEEIMISGQKMMDNLKQFSTMYNCYNESTSSPVAYEAVMSKLNLTNPDRLFKMYRTVEQAYDNSIIAYESYINKFIRYCESNMYDESHKLAYQQTIEDTLKAYNYLVSLDPRYNDTDVPSMSFEGLDEASMEGFFKNLANKIQHFLTRDTKCKKIHEEIAASAKNASKEANDKFQATEHGFKCPTGATLAKTTLTLSKAMKWIIEAGHNIASSTKRDITMSDDAYKAFFKSSKEDFDTLEALNKNYLKDADGKTTYGQLGISIKSAVEAMNKFITVAGERKALKDVDDVLMNTVLYSSAYKKDDNFKSMINVMWYMCDMCFKLYDKTDYVLFRIGKDIKKCL